MKRTLVVISHHSSVRENTNESWDIQWCITKEHCVTFFITYHAIYSVDNSINATGVKHMMKRLDEVQRLSSILIVYIFYGMLYKM